MNWLSELLRRVRMLFRGAFDRELREEMRLPVGIWQRSLIRGNATLLRETSGDAWGWCGLGHFMGGLA